jgi:hypothetical protein
MPKDRYISIDYITRPGASPSFDIALPDGILDRALEADPDLGANLQHLRQYGLAKLDQAVRPESVNPNAFELDTPRSADHLTLMPNRLRRLDAEGRDERHFTAMMLNEVTGTVIADVPHASQQPHALRVHTFSSDGTPNGFIVEADIMLPESATDLLLSRQAATAMAEVSIAYGLELDPGNKPSVVMDTGRTGVKDVEPYIAFSPRPQVSLSGQPLEHAPNVWHLTSDGLNNHEDPLIVLAGLVAITSISPGASTRGTDQV